MSSSARHPIWTGIRARTPTRNPLQSRGQKTKGRRSKKPHAARIPESSPWAGEKGPLSRQGWGETGSSTSQEAVNPVERAQET